MLCHARPYGLLGALRYPKPLQAAAERPKLALRSLIAPTRQPGGDLCYSVDHIVRYRRSYTHHRAARQYVGEGPGKLVLQREGDLGHC